MHSSVRRDSSHHVSIFCILPYWGCSLARACRLKYYYLFLAIWHFVCITAELLCFLVYTGKCQRANYAKKVEEHQIKAVENKADTLRAEHSNRYVRLLNMFTLYQMDFWAVSENLYGIGALNITFRSGAAQFSPFQDSVPNQSKTNPIPCKHSLTYSLCSSPQKCYTCGCQSSRFNSSILMS